MTIKEEIDIIMKRLPEQTNYLMFLSSRVAELNLQRFNLSVRLGEHPEYEGSPEFKRVNLLRESALGVHHNLIERLKFLINETKS